MLHADTCALLSDQSQMLSPSALSRSSCPLLAVPTWDPARSGSPLSLPTGLHLLYAQATPSKTLTMSRLQLQANPSTALASHKAPTEANNSQVGLGIFFHAIEASNWQQPNTPPEGGLLSLKLACTFYELCKEEQKNAQKVKHGTSCLWHPFEINLRGFATGCLLRCRDQWSS